MEDNAFVKQSGFRKAIQKISKKNNTTPGTIVKSSRGNAYVYGNCAEYICSLACSCCWDKPCPTTYPGQLEYLAKRVDTGHTSILEHSNHIIYLEIPTTMVANYYPEFVDAAGRYMKILTANSSDGNTLYMLLGGSYRAIIDIYKRIRNLENPILLQLNKIIYENMPPIYFKDLIKDGILAEESFIAIQPTDKEYADTVSKLNKIKTDLYDIVNIDSLNDIVNRIRIVCPEPELFTIYDLLDMASITILFKDMSRTCTHQLVRHRNAITQESQRYVDYSNADVATPDEFKDRYDSNHKYTIYFGKSDPFKLTLKEIASAESGIYSQLNDKSIAGEEYALIREDARAFLPSNVRCRKLYMTFTYRSFMVFLKLRCEPGAQAEIRKYATSLKEWFNASVVDAEHFDGYLVPFYKIEKSEYELEPYEPVDSNKFTDEIEKLYISEFLPEEETDKE